MNHDEDRMKKLEDLARDLPAVPHDVLARAAKETVTTPEADPVAVQIAAREIYRQLPGSVLAQLQAIARAYGNNRHARRATAAILRRYFNTKAANARKYAAKKANRIESRKTPTEKKIDRLAAEDTSWPLF